MKKTRNTKKKDYVFIIVVLALMACFLLLSLFSKSDDEVIVTPSELPSDETNNISKLVISEIVSSNSGFYYTANGNDFDYIEIYNGKDKDVDLTGYGLSDSTDRVKWMFPDGTVIPAKSYLVVALTGANEDGLYANFKLKSSGGETVILVNKGKKIIDAVDTVNTAKNQALCRDGDGNWFVSEYPTPGFANTEEGLADYYLSITGEKDNALVINEYLPKNNGNYVNEYERLDGYIEFKNISAEAIQLSEYSISNDPYVAFKKMLPDITLGPGEIYLMYCGDAGFQQENYIGFNLDNKNGTIIISHKGVITEKYEYNALANGLAMIRQSDGSYISSSIISPGYQNNDDGIAEFQKENYSGKKGLIISEVMSENTKYLGQNGNRYYDWVELYNNSDEDINLAEYTLSTRDTLDEYTLPDVVLKAHEYIVIMCSGDEALTNKSYYHAPFKISETEALFLGKNGKLVDSLVVNGLPTNYSYGIGTDGYYYSNTPTPKAKNSEGARSITLDPVFKTTAGIYNDVSSVQVEIEGYGTIYYTTDGSKPTTSSKVYSGPINLKKTTVVKAICVDSGKYKSSVVTASYIINENHSVAVVSISMPSSDFSRLNNYPWSDEDIPCTAELFEESGTFNINCAISCFGGNSRNMDKKSYAIKFDKQWGANNLVYPLFDNRDNSVYESIVLRQGSNDWTRTVFRDVMATSLMDDYLDTQDYKACVVYINGEYWGLYNIREKVNAAFISEHYNVSKESVNIVNVDLSTKTGSNSGLISLINYIKTHDMSNNTYYEYVCSKLDVVNVCDYWIAEMFCVNPDVYNVRYFNSTELDGGKWKYIYYDMDHAFRFPTKNYYTEYLCNPYGMEGWVNNVYDNTIPKDLFDNKQFVNLWLERLAYHLQNNLSKENVTAALNHFIDLYANEIERDRKEWANSYDSVVGEYPSMSNYNSNISVIKSFIKTRYSYILNQTKSYFGLSDAKMKEIFGDLW